MIIRKAAPEDAHAIHLAHMASIQEVCANEYTPEQMNVWGNRLYDQTMRIRSIENDHVWVIETGNDSAVRIVGFGHLRMNPNHRAHILGLYLMKTGIGQGVGKRLAEVMIDTARKDGVKEITLESTFTAHSFYSKLGFKDLSDPVSFDFKGIQISCIPMSLNLE